MAALQEPPNLEELLSSSDLPVLVDFYSPWCGREQILQPILEQVKAQFSDRLRLVKIDTERYPQLASRYHIHALPALVLFNHCQELERIEDFISANALIARLQTLIQTA